MQRMKHAPMLLAVLAGTIAAPAFLQAQRRFPPPEMDRLVQRIALYPDPLLAQVLAAATYPNDIPAAARWADEHHYLNGQQLASAIQNDQLPWDPSIQSLLPFPSVLATMSSDMRWTTDLGDAFLSDQQDVMDAVQRERAVAQRYGYLRSNEQVVVSGGPYISIAPVNPGFIVVPYYDPRVVYYAPRPGFVVGSAVRFGFGVSLGGFFSPWGWGGARFDWGRHDVFIANERWGRTWGNRTVYVHPYEGFRRPERDRVVVSRPVEEHRLERRSGDERRAEREGRPEPREEHGRDKDRGRGKDAGRGKDGGRDRDRR